MPDDIKDEYRQHDPGKGWAGGCFVFAEQFDKQE